jgi:hypothetical protein
LKECLQAVVGFAIPLRTQKFRGVNNFLVRNFSCALCVLKQAKKAGGFGNLWGE